jgi:hypothetical protein
MYRSPEDCMVDSIAELLHRERRRQGLKTKIGSRPGAMEDFLEVS